ncbi:DUF262 domain-containing protein [Streptococcus suis]|uniref:DUF262 domain-containing protein n=1 Tax=Streptococcus suis TaxID=1307 RepID=UPI0005CF7A9E|nr:DUF262 domain-containing protein [Streptococcus suis]NQH66690.1 DUF262 domain-containing protein [Streptococcus suis]NQO20383.1 DUF262 domain-containing protein [Streptococcus suis]NQO24646.1 DUF262 domain-containing protein [Streptococcus suis]CYV18348.1 Protein of uncharacterised function DUF262 [Streptococcus suis]CYV28734.1 Protein of uncharacterised function DUF262 [Streptococcus suis]
MLDKKLVRRNFDISFNELYDMYNDGELIIRPEFQRLFRWSLTQQSLFIESLLLDMPIPPIYVDEQEDGSYVLVDGLQRISSYLNFRGLSLSNSDDEFVQREEVSEEDDIFDDDIFAPTVQPSFALSGCEIIDDLNGKSYNDLSIEEKRQLKRTFIRVEVLTKDNPKEIKYHMFKRLNSGGALLSKQELRNSNIRMVSEKFIDFINELARNEDFVSITSNMTKSEKQQMKRSETVLRYFLFKNKFINDDPYVKMNYLDDELTEYLEDVSSERIDFDYLAEQENFISLVQYLNSKFSSEIFNNIGRNGRSAKKFIQYNFDGFMQYFSEPTKRREDIMIEQINDIKQSNEYRMYRTGGLENSRKRVEVIENKLNG